jgi:glutathione S-transferase
MQPPELRLIGFAGCPFFHRAGIVLHEKLLAFTPQVVDRERPPEWLGALAPRGHTPVLLLGAQPVFDSTAISELLEETHPEPALLPADPLLRARERGWWDFAGQQIYRLLRGLLLAPDDDARADLDARVAVLEAELGARAWLSGDGTRFGLADVAFAPVAARLPVFEELGLWSLPSGMHNVRRWSDQLRTRASVARSFPPAATDAIRRRHANQRRAS